MPDQISRRHLPQINGEDQSKFIEFLKANGMKTKRGKVLVSKLHPIQTAVDKNKIARIMDSEGGVKTPLIISKRGNILDGHHRYLAIKQLGNKYAPVIYCKCDINKLAALGHKFVKENASDSSEDKFSNIRAYPKSQSPENNSDNTPFAPGTSGGFGGNYGYSSYRESIINSTVDELLERKKKSSGRDYKREYETYHKSPKQKKRRAQRNRSRRKMERAGKVKKGSSMDVHHKNHDTSDDSSDNLAVISRSKNRSMK